MKANYKKNIGTRYQPLTAQEKKVIQEEADKEFNRRYSELYLMMQKSIAVQYTAAVMTTLEQWYGWGSQRQRQFFDRVNNTYADMGGVGFSGEYDALDLVEHIKEKFGIDLNEEIEVELKEETT